jgi:thymidylate synthase
MKEKTEKHFLLLEGIKNMMMTIKVKKKNYIYTHDIIDTHVYENGSV